MKKYRGAGRQVISWILAVVLLCTAMPVSANAAKKVKLNKTSVKLKVGKQVTLKLKNNKKKVTWSSANKKIATVSKTGRVKARKKGNTKIIAKVKKKKYVCKVTVVAKKTATSTTAPTVAPTAAPIVLPTTAPTTAPIASPTAAPTASPTATSTVTPTVAPTVTPTASPTAAPTVTPTVAPTVTPTASPTAAPTVTPTTAPTVTPTASPTAAPTVTPTASPTAAPTVTPTAAPTATPTAAPTVTPTASPTVTPTASPTVTPTASPTAAPTAAPTATPTVAPTATPTAAPTATPTVTPTATPTAAPTATPTVTPTATPTVAPTVAPTATPTAAPTATPTVAPTATPTATPTVAPTASPTASPSETIPDGVNPFNMGSKCLWIGMSQTAVQSALSGCTLRTGTSPQGYDYIAYHNTTYSEYVLLYLKDDAVVGICGIGSTMNYGSLVTAGDSETTLQENGFSQLSDYSVYANGSKTTQAGAYTTKDSSGTTVIAFINGGGEKDVYCIQVFQDSTKTINAMIYAEDNEYNDTIVSGIATEVEYMLRAYGKVYSKTLYITSGLIACAQSYVDAAGSTANSITARGSAALLAALLENDVDPLNYGEACLDSCADAISAMNSLVEQQEISTNLRNDYPYIGVGAAYKKTLLVVLDYCDEIE